MNSFKKSDIRAYTSISLLVTGIFLPLSIFFRHLPLFEKSKQSFHMFNSIHATSGLLFVILLIIHLNLNWEAVKKYFKNERQSKTRKDVLLTGLCTMIFIILIAVID